jgi:NitT/TauT family transport system permease protein
VNFVVAASPTRPGLAARSRGWLPVLGGAVLVLAAWKAVVVAFDYPPFILPAPEVVFVRLVRAWADGLIEPHAVATLTEILLGFAAGALTGVAVGALLARSHLAERVLSPYLVAAQATPILALAPLIALWFGTGLFGKVVICGLIVFFPIAISTMVGLRGVDRGLLEMARSFRATRRQLLAAVEIPAALPSILGGMGVGITLAVIGAIVGEWAGGERGLGVLINLARGSLFDTPLLFATLVTTAALGIALYAVMTVIERRLVGDRG